MERPVPKRFCEFGMGGPCTPTASAESAFGSEPSSEVGLMELMMLLPPKITPWPRLPGNCGVGAPAWYEMP